MKSLDFKNTAWSLLATSVALSFIGLVSIYSTTQNKGGDFFLKQIIWLIIGLALFFIFSSIDYRFFKTHFAPVLFLYFIGIATLFIVYLFGVEIRATQRWADLGFIVIQPVEPLKIIFILILAKYFSQRHVEMYKLKHVIITGFYLLLPSVFIILQPDFGSFMILALIWFGIIVISGIKLKHFMILVLFAAFLAVFAWGFVLADYQKARISNFLNPQMDPYGAGYNSRQALIAIGSGGLWGNGIFQGTQSQLGFLPEAHTDFIYSAIVEELGAIVGVLILILYGFIFFKMLAIAKKAPDNFAKLLTIGIGMMFVLQVGLNVGMTLGIVPITGLTLPLVSYGGSSLLTVYIALGIINSIYKNSTESIAIGEKDKTEQDFAIVQ